VKISVFSIDFSFLFSSKRGVKRVVPEELSWLYTVAIIFKDKLIGTWPFKIKKPVSAFRDIMWHKLTKKICE
jgi:hypothetical protein